MIALSLTKGLPYLKPAAYYILGISLYAIFVFKFYRFLACKDVFKIDLKQYNTSTFPLMRKSMGFLYYVVEYLFFFPLLVFFWFAVLTLLLALLAKTQTVDSLLLVAIGVVGAIRVTAYYDEDLSKDLAKMLPFALLGVYLVDIHYISVMDAWNLIQSIPNYFIALMYYFAFIIFLEFILRLLYALLNRKEVKE